MSFRAERLGDAGHGRMLAVYGACSVEALELRGGPKDALAVMIMTSPRDTNNMLPIVGTVASMAALVTAIEDSAYVAGQDAALSAQLDQARATMRETRAREAGDGGDDGTQG